MLPRHLDGGFHTVSQDDKLRRSAIVMGAKAHDVHLGHSARKIAKKPEESKGTDWEVRGVAIWTARWSQRLPCYWLRLTT